jgi:hypothetical protein
MSLVAHSHLQRRVLLQVNPQQPAALLYAPLQRLQLRYDLCKTLWLIVYMMTCRNFMLASLGAPHNRLQISKPQRCMLPELPPRGAVCCWAASAAIGGCCADPTKLWCNCGQAAEVCKCVVQLH